MAASGESGDYEEQRRRALAAKAALAAELGMTDLKRGLEAAAAAEPSKRRRIPAQAQRRDPALDLPRRRSLRVQGIGADGSVIEHALPKEVRLGGLGRRREGMTSV